MSRYVARFLAPLAIVAVAAGVYFVVHDNLAGHRSSSAHISGRSHRHRHHHHVHVATHAKPRYYTVKSGDTLSAIASRTRVSLVQLEALNPKLKPPYSLQSGERLRLSR